MNRLKALLDAVARRRAAPEWIEGRARVAASHADLLAYLQSHPQAQIYGVNTLSGHRDDHRLDLARARLFQRELIESHTISDAGDYEQDVALTIMAAKLQQLSQGGATITEPLYAALLSAFEDRDFRPKVPVASSYSSGDVIPGAHWARSVLEHLERGEKRFDLQPGEGMALINGSFVHLGFAASVVEPLAALWAMQLDAMRADIALGEADTAMLDYARLGGMLPQAALDHIGGSAQRQTGGGAQWPVSFRAMPETAGLLFTAYGEFLGEIENQLGRPSGNPLLAKGDGGVAPHAQASFLLPLLAVRSSAVLEALLFSATAELGRTKWLLGGLVPGLPRDGQAGPDDVAFIQWPKLMQAMVEDLRLALGRTLYASGGDTSFGVEDLWTGGVANIERLDGAIALSQRITGLGLRLKIRLAQRFGLENGLDGALRDIVQQGGTAQRETQAVIGYYAGPEKARLRGMLI